MSEKGNLVVIGTGIRSITQLTLEAILHIEKADKVYYGVCDAATEGFIKGKNQNAVDLTQYYGNDKPRVDTYIQMAEVMLQDVRKGLHVVGAFYGHPGSFVSPTRRAISIARDEGYPAIMLPGISAEDNLLADLLIDPGKNGLQTLEATDLILHDQPLMTSGHVILYQVGLVGQPGFDFTHLENDKFSLLVDKLEEVYGSCHPVVNYVAAVAPLEKPIMDKFSIGDLRKPNVQQQIGGLSTFYIPPKEIRAVTNGGNRLRIASGTTAKQVRAGSYPPNPFYQPPGDYAAPYEEYSKKVVAALQNHSIPPGYGQYVASTAMQQAVERLSLDMDALEAYLKSPAQFVDSFPGLTQLEKEALESQDQIKINAVMKEGLSPQRLACFCIVH